MGFSYRIKNNKNGISNNDNTHTLKLTNLIKLKKGSLVNIEFDLFGKYLLNASK